MGGGIVTSRSLSLHTTIRRTCSMAAELSLCMARARATEVEIPGTVVPGKAWRAAMSVRQSDSTALASGRGGMTMTEDASSGVAPAAGGAGGATDCSASMCDSADMAALALEDRTPPPARPMRAVHAATVARTSPVEPAGRRGGRGGVDLTR